MAETNVVQALIAPNKYVGLEGVTRDDLTRVATTATMPGETIHNLPFPVDATIVCDAMIAADAYGRAFLEAAGTVELVTP